jgi:hypothetical protein
MLTMPVPDTLTSPYLVPTSDPPADAVRLAAEQVRRTLPTPLRARTLQLVESSHVTIVVLPVDDFPSLDSPWLTALGATDVQLRAIRSATHAVGIFNTYSPAGPAAHLWVSRAVAYSLACALSAPVVDEAQPRVFDAAAVGSSLPDTDGVLPMSHWVMTLQSPDGHGYWCTTTGLTRFGLPELQALDVPPRLRELWAVAMTGLAQRLVEIWSAEVRAHPGAPFVEFPDVVSVSAADVAAAYRREPSGRGSVELHLAREVEGPLGPVFLTVRDPDHRAVCDALFGVTYP